jgi:hypothetical protein
MGSRGDELDDELGSWEEDNLGKSRRDGSEVWEICGLFPGRGWEWWKGRGVGESGPRERMEPI